MNEIDGCLRRKDTDDDSSRTAVSVVLMPRDLSSIFSER